MTEQGTVNCHIAINGTFPAFVVNKGDRQFCLAMVIWCEMMFSFTLLIFINN